MSRINPNFNYLIRSNPNETVHLKTNNYDIKYDPTNYNILEKFERLEWEISSTIPSEILLGNINLNGKYAPIDLIILNNRNNLFKIADAYNYQDNIKFNNNDSSFNRLIKKENIFNVISSLRKESDIYENRIIKYNKIYDRNYSKYMYRAAKNEIAYINKNNIISKNISDNYPYNIPVFSVYSINPIDQISFYLKLKNIEVPMRIVETSVHNNIHSYIVIYPEYILMNFKDYIDSIMYIKLDKGTIQDNKIYYSFLKDNILFPVISDTLSHLSNLRNSRTFF